jgi:hypothetical protein
VPPHTTTGAYALPPPRNLTLAHRHLWSSAPPLIASSTSSSPPDLAWITSSALPVHRLQRPQPESPLSYLVPIWFWMKWEVPILHCMWIVMNWFLNEFVFSSDFWMKWDVFLYLKATVPRAVPGPQCRLGVLARHGPLNNCVVLGRGWEGTSSVGLMPARPGTTRWSGIAAGKLTQERDWAGRMKINFRPKEKQMFLDLQNFCKEIRSKD